MTRVVFVRVTNNGTSQMAAGLFLQAVSRADQRLVARLAGSATHQGKSSGE